jgi:AraC-like DNA-binding protein
MIIERQIPAQSLQPFIREYVIIESGENRVNRILPDTSLAIAFRFKGQLNLISNDKPVGLPGIVISGLRKTARLINYTANTGNIIAIFNEGTASSFFKEPVHHLFNNSISPGDLISKQIVSDTQERLNESVNTHQRIATINHFFSSLFTGQKQDELVAHALQKIHAANGTIKIKELADTLFISQDAFEKRFRKSVGTSPKQFSSIVRMKSAISILKKKQRLVDTAFDTGFFDQPHFNKDFKLFTGQSPTEFVGSSPQW